MLDSEPRILSIFPMFHLARTPPGLPQPTSAPFWLIFRRNLTTGTNNILRESLSTNETNFSSHVFFHRIVFPNPEFAFHNTY